MKLVGFVKIDQMYPEKFLDLREISVGCLIENTIMSPTWLKILRSKILVGWSTFGEEIEKEYPPPKNFAKKNQDFKS